jgi:hypothetical protein
MDHLPQELIDNITSFLPLCDLKYVLTLSKSFQYAAEISSGAFQAFELKESNTEKFVALYSGHRLPYLRVVELKPSFPKVENKNIQEMSRRETLMELREKDVYFTRQIKILLCALKEVERHHKTNSLTGRYRLVLYSPATLVKRDRSHVDFNHEYRSWCIHLRNPETLPTISSARSLEIQNSGFSRTDVCENSYDTIESKLDLRIIIDLAASLPNIESLDCKVGSYEWYNRRQPEDIAKHDWDEPRRDSRHGFAKAVSIAVDRLPKQLTRVNLDFIHPLANAIHIGQSQRLPDLVSPMVKDPFSSSLRLLSCHLRQVQLRAVVDESLFWLKDSGTTSWPNLECLDVMFDIARPDGSWYFQGPPKEDYDLVGSEITGMYCPPLELYSSDDEMDIVIANECMAYYYSKFRNIPIDSNLQPFLEGFARAAYHMPSLREARIWTPLSWDIGGEDGLSDLSKTGEMVWGIAYRAPGALEFNATQVDGHSSGRQLYWKVSQWRPTSPLHKCFQNIGSQRHGDVLKEYWAGDHCGNSSGPRGFFEE